MLKNNHQNLSRRERQIMDVIYAREEATASEVLEALPDPPGYSAVRAMLRLLEEKGHISHRRDGRKYVFAPTVARETASHSAMGNLLQTFFNGSVERAVSSLLDMKAKNLTVDDLDRLADLIEKKRKEERQS
jgi:BlaI family penicillinase repressor